MGYTTAGDLRLQSGEFDDANHCAAHNIEHFHDFRVVRPLEVSEFATLDRHRCQLVHCAPGVLFHGARKPNRILSIQNGYTAETQRGAENAEENPG